MSTKNLDWNKFKKCFDESWHPLMQEFVESDECAKIYSALRSSKTKVYPESTKTWDSFKLTRQDNIRSIWVDALDLLKPNTSDIWDGIDEILDRKVDRTNMGFLMSQGVLFVNSSLTTEYRAEKRHMNIWEPFWEYMFENLLDTCTGIPILLVGENAKNLKKFINPAQPYREIKYIDSDDMLWMNDMLKKNNDFIIEFDEKNYLPF